MANLEEIGLPREFSGGEQEFNPRRYLGILRRRLLYFVVPLIVISAGGFWFSRILPPVYLARATILVESQQIPTGLAQSTVTGNASERIQLIQQRLMTRDNLLAIAEKYGLYAGDDFSRSELVDKMREATQIRQIDVGRTARQETQEIGFTVGFSYRDAGAAANVANEFVASILQQNIQSRTTRAGETRKFFEQRVVQIEKELGNLELKIVDFKKINEGALPETLSARRTMLQQMEAGLSEIERKIAYANDPKLLQAEKEKVERLNRELAAKKRDLTFAKEELEQFRPLAEKGVIPQNRVRDMERNISALEISVAAVESDLENEDDTSQRTFLVAQLVEEKASLAKKIEGLNLGILKTPQVESELIALTRAYENMQQDYRDAKMKASEAEIGTQLEEDRQAERFEVIEQATVPSAPISPNRRRIATMGVIAGVAAGAGLVMLLEALDRSIRGAADLDRIGIRPIATIPFVETASDRQRKRKMIAGLLAILLIAIVFGLVVIQSFYMPLDSFAERLLARIGL